MCGPPVDDLICHHSALVNLNVHSQSASGRMSFLHSKPEVVKVVLHCLAGHIRYQESWEGTLGGDGTARVFSPHFTYTLLKGRM